MVPEEDVKERHTSEEPRDPGRVSQITDEAAAAIAPVRLKNVAERESEASEESKSAIMTPQATVKTPKALRIRREGRPPRDAQAAAAMVVAELHKLNGLAP